MIQVRPQQFETFERNALGQFENEMVAHLREFHPGHATAAGETGLRKLIQTGIERAKGYGFALRGSVRFYLEQMMLYGHDFDTDPLLPWAARELRTGGGAELVRADRMHAVAQKYHETAVGKDGEYEQQAIRRILKDPVSVWLSGDLSPSGTEVRLREVYPEKCSAADSKELPNVVGRARFRAKEHSLPESTGGLVFAALTVALGQGYLTDPMYPWIAGNLRDTAGQSGELRVEKLTTRAMAFLSAVLAEHEKG